jgi:hypothetical protein
MGLLSELLLLPLAPARLALWAIDHVMDTASREHNNPAAVRRELAELNRQLDAGSISEEEFDRREDELLDRLYGTPNPEGGGPHDGSLAQQPAPGIEPGRRAGTGA